MSSVEIQSRPVVLELTEKVNLPALRIIRDNFEEVFKRMGGKMKLFNEKTHEYEVCADYSQAHTIINELYNSKKDTNKVKYHYTARVDYGRRFAPKSLQGTAREIRHAIAKDIYIDLDFKNAHPCIQERKCMEMDFKHEPLSHYIANRDVVLKERIGKEMKMWVWEDAEKTKGHHNTIIAKKDDVKQGFLTLLNGGSNRFQNDEFANLFEQRQKEFVKEFCNYRQYPDHNKYVHRSKNKTFNADGSALNYYFCDVEDKLLQHVENCLQDRDIKYGTLCFDGLQIYESSLRGNYNIQDVLADIEESLNTSFNYPFKLSVKPMDEDVSLVGLVEKPDLKVSDVDYAIYILDKLKDDIKFHTKLNQMYKWSSSLALWRPIKIENMISFIPDLLVPHINTSPDPDQVQKELSQIHSSSRQKSILYQLKNRIEMREDDDFIQKNFDVKKGLIPIKDNKTIDMRTCEVRPRVREDYFTKTTDRVFKPNYNKAKVIEYYESILTQHLIKTVENDEKVIIKNKPSVEYRECFEQVIAYSMTGENNLKKFVNLIGNGDNGKSVFIELHQEIFTGFSTQGNKRTFISQKSQSNHDAEIMGLINSRFVSLTELKKREAFNEELIKAISGGDTQKVRGCGQKDTIEVLFSCVLWIATNELAKFENEQFKNRLLCVDFANKFEKNTKYVEELKEMYDDFFTHLCLSAQKYYDNKRSITFCPEIEDYTNKMKDSQNSFLNWINQQDVFEHKMDNETGEELNREELRDDYSRYCKDNDVTKFANFYKLFETHFNVEVKQKHTGNCSYRYYPTIYKL